MNLEVKTSKVQFIAAVVLAILMLPLGLGSLFMGLSGMKVMPMMVGVVCLAVVIGVFFLFGRGGRYSVTAFNDRGLVRGDKSELPWSDLERVVDLIKADGRQRYIWRTEIHFTYGRSAWVIPQKVVNYPEVRALIERLPCEHTESAA